MREEPAATLIKVTAIAAISGRKSVREREERDEDVVVMVYPGCWRGHVARQVRPKAGASVVTEAAADQFNCV
jgi:hypothetical protein